jgi:hypothetical protein
MVIIARRGSVSQTWRSTTRPTTAACLGTASVALRRGSRRRAGTSTRTSTRTSIGSSFFAGYTVVGDRGRWSVFLRWWSGGRSSGLGSISACWRGRRLLWSLISLLNFKFLHPLEFSAGLSESLQASVNTFLLLEISRHVCFVISLWILCWFVVKFERPTTGRSCNWGR